MPSPPGILEAPMKHWESAARCVVTLEAYASVGPDALRSRARRADRTRSGHSPSPHPFFPFVEEEEGRTEDRKEEDA
jgi:hypothetical protein